MLMEQAKSLMFKFWEHTGNLDQKRIATLTPTAGITEIRDLAYIDDGNKYHLLDIYYPDGTENNLPVIIDIHGGGFMYGDKELNKYYCLYLASLGFTVVNISYRLCPDVTIIEQIQDIFAAYHWLDENGAKYKCDMKNVFCTGDSAGGYFVAISCEIMGREDMCEALGVTLPRLRFNAVGTVSGAFDPARLFSKNMILFKAYKQICLGVFEGDHPLSNYLNASKFVGGTKFPPIYMVSSKQDFIVSQSDMFSEKLSEYNVYHRYRRWGRSRKNTLMHVFSVLHPEWKESEVSISEMTSLFTEYMV